jgi:hypothetical protein
MDKTTKKILVVVGAFAVLAIMLVGITGAYIHRGGMVIVQVCERGPDGCDIKLQIPGALINAAMYVVPDEAFEDAEDEIKQFGPLIRAACNKLSDLPDFVLVEVQDRHEHVEIAKRDGKLVIDVRSPCERVHVVVPFSVVKTAAKRFDRIAA